MAGLYEREEGSAFPILDDHRNYGLSKREYFAAMALVGMGTWMPTYSGGSMVEEEGLKARARWAFLQADAMIEASQPKKD